MLWGRSVNIEREIKEGVKSGRHASEATEQYLHFHVKAAQRECSADTHSRPTTTRPRRRVYKHGAETCSSKRSPAWEENRQHNGGTDVSTAQE